MKQATISIARRVGIFAVAAVMFSRCVAGATERVLPFPRDRSLGMLYMLDAKIERKIEDFYYSIDGTGMKWEYLGEATGDVTVPARKRLKLVVNKTDANDLSPLSKLGADDLYQLDLSEGLDGRALAQITALTGLKVLSFPRTFPRTSQHKFTREELNQFVPLKSLERLSAPEQIDDAGLAALVESLPQLRGLYFSKNQLTDSGITVISKLPKLEELSIGGDKITGRSLGALGKLQSLHYLDLWGNMPKDDALREVRNITGLKTLKAPETITDSGLAYLAGHPNLETLSLFNTKVSDRGMAHLTSLPSLKKLDLTKKDFDRRNPPITDAATVHLKRIKMLEDVRLPGEGISDTGLANLAGLPNLKALALPMFHSTDRKRYLNPYTEEGLRALAKIRLLESLSIAGPGITDAALSQVAQMTNLQSLMLFGCPVGDEGMSKLITLQSLESFTLMNGSHVTVSGLNRLSGLPKLARLQVDVSTKRGIPLNIAGMTRLESLMISPERGSTFRDDDLACLANLKQLKWLQLGSTHLEITDVGMARIAGLTLLERLVLGGPGVTDRGLAVLTNMPRLDLVKISGNFTDAGLQRIETLTGLRSLWIYSSTNFTSGAKERLRKSLPNLYHFTAEQDRAVGVVISSSHPTPGTLAPDFTVTTLDGAKFKLSEQRGKVVMLHYWGTWCAPCIKGFPELIKVHARLKDKYGDRVVFLGLAMDDDEIKLREIVEKHTLTAPQARIGMQSKIAESYGVTGAPDDFMIGPDGRILLNQESPEDSADTEAVIDKALGLTKAH